MFSSDNLKSGEGFGRCVYAQFLLDVKSIDTTGATAGRTLVQNFNSPVGIYHRYIFKLQN